MKRLCLIIIFLTSFAGSFAQSVNIYSAFSIGAGVGTTTVYDYVLAAQNKYAVNGTFSYNITPFFTLTGESQFGKFEGGDLTAFNMKYFYSTYAAATLHADLQLGELIDYGRSDFLYGLKDAYFGSGFGLLENSITYVQPISPNSNTLYNTVNSSTNFLVPFVLGYDIKIFNDYDEPQIRLDISYTLNAAFGQGIDGYVTAAPVKFYSYFAVGVKYGFGPGKLYRKPIRY